MDVLMVLLVLAALVAFSFIGAYNNLVRLRQNVKESWSAIQTELNRRFDLIPNLVEVVKGYAEHERNTLEEVITARNNAVAAKNTPDSLDSANKALTGAVNHLFALSESYPELKANQNFQSLQEELSQTETRISQARRFYNANVRELNNACETFPSVLIARSMGFHPEIYFGIEDADAYEPVKISGLSSSEKEIERTSAPDNHVIEIKQAEKELD